MENNKIEDLLKTISEIQSFDDMPDDLTRIIRENTEETELDCDTLDFVTAASGESIQGFKDFMKAIMKDKPNS